MPEQTKKIVKKLVQPYPISAVLEAGNLKIPMSINYVSPKGFVGHVKGGILMVGTLYTVTFELPVLRETIRAEGKVYKTFDRPVDPQQKIVERLAEILFLNLTKEHKSLLESFVKAIKQKN